MLRWRRLSQIGAKGSREATIGGRSEHFDQRIDVLTTSSWPGDERMQICYRLWV